MKLLKADKFEGLIRQACREYAEAVPCPDEVPEHDFSPEFEAKMAALAKRTERRTSVLRFVQRAAAVFVAVVVALGGWLAVDGETRADFVSWLRESYESSVLYSFINETTDTALPDVELGWLPEGYELVTEEKDDTQLILVYQNPESNKEMIFSVSRPGDDGYFGLIFGESEVKHIQAKINGMHADMYIPYDESINSGLVWIDEENNLIYSILAHLNKDDILHIAEQVKPAE